MIICLFQSSKSENPRNSPLRRFIFILSLLGVICILLPHIIPYLKQIVVDIGEGYNLAIFAITISASFLLFAAPLGVTIQHLIFLVVHAEYSELGEFLKTPGNKEDLDELRNEAQNFLFRLDRFSLIFKTAIGFLVGSSFLTFVIGLIFLFKTYAKTDTFWPCLLVSLLGFQCSVVFLIFIIASRKYTPLVDIFGIFKKRLKIQYNLVPKNNK